MAEIRTDTFMEFNEMEISINKLIQRQIFPVLVKTPTQIEQRSIFGNRCMPENKEMLLQRTMRVKYAHLNVFTSCDAASTDDIGDNHYLLPVKYHGKFRFVHRPGKRKRYASVSELLQDLPRFITVWEDTPATSSSNEDEHTIVEAGTTLEIVRKYTKSDDNHTYLECSDGATSVAFVDQERLNCTAIDDSKLYNLFEVVRSKLLPRFIQFEDVDPNDIAHVDDSLHTEATTAIEYPMELQGFIEIDILIGYIRNEINETYESVLIPRDLWRSLFVHEVYSTSRDKTQEYIARLYGPVGEFNFIEKSFYLFPIHLHQVVCLIGPSFKHRRNYQGLNSVDQNIEEENDVMIRGSVILLPQVKKKKTLFKKVHDEILRLFQSRNDEKTVPTTSKKQTIAEKKKTKRHTKSTQDPNPRNATSLQLRHEPLHLRLIRQRYGNASYLEFYDGNPISRLSGDTPVHLRLSLSLGDLPSCISSPKGGSSFGTHDINSSLSNLWQPEYAEIVDIRAPNETVSPNNTHLYDRQTFSQSQSFPAASEPIFPRAQLLRNEPQSEFQNQQLFYSYNTAQTYRCFRDCGLDDFAVKCRKHQLDGSFFRNFDLTLLKDDPFNLSNFTLLKVQKIIYEGWRPT